jgi:hypothetical protein
MPEGRGVAPAGYTAVTPWIEQQPFVDAMAEVQASLDRAMRRR